MENGSFHKYSNLEPYGSRTKSYFWIAICGTGILSGCCATGIAVLFCSSELCDQLFLMSNLQAPHPNHHGPRTIFSVTRIYTIQIKPCACVPVIARDQSTPGWDKVEFSKNKVRDMKLSSCRVGMFMWPRWAATFALINTPTLSSLLSTLNSKPFLTTRASWNLK